MPETPQTDHQHNKETEIDKSVHGKESLPEGSPIRLPVRLRWIFFSGGFLLVALLVVSFVAPYMAERVKFFTVNALSLLVLLAIVVQAYIYRRQADTLDKQSGAMREQLAAMEWQAEIMEIQAGLFDKQVNAMQGQLEIMRDTQKHFAVGERAYLMLEDVVFVEKGEHPKLIYTLFNGGRTPAFDVTSDTEASLGTEPLTDKFKSLGHPHGDTVALALRNRCRERSQTSQ